MKIKLTKTHAGIAAGVLALTGGTALYNHQTQIAQSAANDAALASFHFKEPSVSPKTNTDTMEADSDYIATLLNGKSLKSIFGNTIFSGYASNSNQTPFFKKGGIIQEDITGWGGEDVSIETVATDIIPLSDIGSYGGGAGGYFGGGGYYGGGGLCCVGGGGGHHHDDHDNPPVTNTPAVPEPATWGMMVVGFGLVGAFLRRQKSNSGPAPAI